MMKWILLAALVLMLIGAGLFRHARTLPVYTDRKAVGELALELNAGSSGDRTGRWYQRVAAYETPHKRLSDLGRGLMALGAGLAVSWAFLWGYGWIGMKRKRSYVLGVWLILWSCRAPAAVWYYKLRLERGDYPIWSDSIGIPIFSEFISCGVGALISTAILIGMIRRKPLPEKLDLMRPDRSWRQARPIWVTIWISLNVLLVLTSITDGHEGTVFTCLVAAAILLLFLPGRGGIEIQSPKHEIQNEEEDARADEGGGRGSVGPGGCAPPEV